MDEHNPENTERQEKDPYDEFEQRIRTIGIVIDEVMSRELTSFRTGWHGLKLNKRLGHSLTLATLVALIFYTCYTVKIYKATAQSAAAAKASADTNAKQLADFENSQAGRLVVEDTRLELKKLPDYASF